MTTSEPAGPSSADGAPPEGAPPEGIPPEGGFAALGLSASLCQVVAELGFAAPTPVQARAIPLLLAGRDLIGQSTTGSGKTAAFALAILQKLKRDERYPQATARMKSRSRPWLEPISAAVSSPAAIR